MATWHFASGQGLTPRGAGSGEIDTFKGAPIRSLAREICQNSLDALVPEEKAKRARGEDALTVMVSFQAFSGIVPEKQALLNYVARMRSYWTNRQKNDLTVVHFLDGVIESLECESVPFLRISDFNTSGLCRIGQTGSPWDNLVMSIGVSDKNPTDGGSKGVGHAAPFACSGLQTVFYFTKNIEHQQAFEGVARLVGWEEGSLGFEEIGYFGNGPVGKSPLQDRIELGDGYVRTEPGTDVYIGGFNQNNWVDGVIQSAIDSFLLAIFRHKLEIRVENETISSQNLATIIEDRQSRGCSFLNHADQYYKVLISSESKQFSYEVVQPDMRGRFVLKLLIDPSLDVKRVALVRDTGMLIFEQGYISSNIKFAGVLEVVGDELNAFLRRLENGQHTEWSAERAKQGEKRKAEDLLKSIRDFCRKSLHSMNEIKPGDKIDSGLGNSFNQGNQADSASAEEEEDVSDELKPIGGQQKRNPHPKKELENENAALEPQKTKAAERMALAAAIIPQRDPAGGGVKGGTLSDTNGNGVKWIDVEATDLDYVCVDKVQSEYQIVFTPDSGFQHGKVKLDVRGETDSYNAEIKTARLENGTPLTIVGGNEIEGLDFVKGLRVSLFVKLDYADYCSLEITTHGHN